MIRRWHTIVIVIAAALIAADGGNYANRQSPDKETVALLKKKNCLMKAQFDRQNRVTALAIGGPNFADADMKRLQGLAELRRLDFYAARITDVGLIHLQKLEDLQSLTFTTTLISDSGLACLTGLPRLEELVLVRTRITDAGLSHLYNMPQLKSLTLVRTNVTEAGLRDLRSTMPEVKIDFQRWGSENDVKPLKQRGWIEGTRGRTATAPLASAGLDMEALAQRKQILATALREQRSQQSRFEAIAEDLTGKIQQARTSENLSRINGLTAQREECKARLRLVQLSRRQLEQDLAICARKIVFYQPSPEPDVDGVVTSILVKDNLRFIGVSVGSEDGLQNRHELKVICNESQWAKIQLVSVGPRKSMGRIISESPSAKVKVGNRVQSRAPMEPKAPNSTDEPAPVEEIPTPLVRGVILTVVVTNANENAGFVTVSMGSDDGVLPGDSMRVFRGTEYLGRIEVTSVGRRKSSAKVNPSLRISNLRRGDRVELRLVLREPPAAQRRGR